MADLEQDYGYKLSTDLGIKECSEPPVDLFQQYYNNFLNFSASERQELADFSFSLVALAKENNVNDTVGVNYLAKFLNHFCPNGKNMLQLNEHGKHAILSVFSSESAFVKKAINVSNCTR